LVVAGGDEQSGGGFDADPVAGDEFGCGCCVKRAEDVVDSFDLGVKELDTAGQLAQSELGCPVDGGWIRWSEPGRNRDEFLGCQSPERFP
jgi:hypothetical protein